jgi:uncharacterized membrane protein
MMISASRKSRASSRFFRETSGQFALMTALLTPVAITLAAFAVDAGSLYVEKRQAQGLADLAAITAAANIDRAELAARTTLEDNGASSDDVVAITGHYDPAAPVGSRFVAGKAPANAVRVEYRTIGSRYFAGAIIPPPQIGVSAIAASSADAAFSVGSRLAALNGGVLNDLLGGLTGTTISLSVMDYNALLAADVNLLAFLNTLALELDLTAGSYDQALASNVTLGQLGQALSKTAGLDGNTKAAASRLASQASGSQSRKLRLSRLIDFGGGRGNVLAASIEQVGASIGVMELLTASAIVAGNGRQVEIKNGLNLPGLLKTSIELGIGEPPQHAPWFRIGSGGEVVRTAQTRLALTTEINGLGGILGTRIAIPLYLELAFAEAKLNSVTCPSGGPSSARIAVDARPGIANLYLAEVDRKKLAGFANPMARSPARLIQMPLVNISAQAHVEVAEMSYRPLIFKAADIKSRAPKQVSTTQITTSLTKSLLTGLSFNIELPLGIAIGLPSNVTTLLGNALGAATPSLDAVLAQVLSTLGLSLGQADVTVHGASCGRAVLVQ